MIKNTVRNVNGVIEIRTNVPDFAVKGKEVVNGVSDRLRSANKKIAEASVSIMKASIDGTKAIATGKLYRSVTTKEDEVGSNYFQSIIYFKGVDYVHFANYGRGAGKMPPIDNIRKWMDKKGIPRNRLGKIAFNIAAYGTEGKHFIEDALPRIRKKANSIFNAEMKKAIDGN